MSGTGLIQNNIFRISLAHKKIMPKRLCPFNENVPQLKQHVDARHVGKEEYQKEVFQKTKELMKIGAIAAQKKENKVCQEHLECKNSKGKVNIGPVYKVLKEKSGCYYCLNKSSSVTSLSTCYYCNKNMCNNTCSKVCSSCGFDFCPSCCEINYEYIAERVLCIGCYGP